MALKNYIQLVLIAVQLLIVGWELHRLKKGSLPVALSWTLCSIVCALGAIVFAVGLLK